MNTESVAEAKMKGLTIMTDNNKRVIFLARIPREDKQAFYDMCDMQAIKPAEVIRRMMKQFCDDMRELEARKWGNCDYDETWDD